MGLPCPKKIEGIRSLMATPTQLEVTQVKRLLIQSYRAERCEPAALRNKESRSLARGSRAAGGARCSSPKRGPAQQSHGTRLRGSHGPSTRAGLEFRLKHLARDAL